MLFLGTMTDLGLAYLLAGLEILRQLDLSHAALANSLDELIVTGLRRDDVPILDLRLGARLTTAACGFRRGRARGMCP